jgi:hypothetical protein
LKGLEALSKVLSASMWLKMPDPALLIDLYQGVLDYAVNTGALENKDFLEYTSTAGTDSFDTATAKVNTVTHKPDSNEAEDPQTETTATDSTSYAIDGDAGQSIANALRIASTKGDNEKVRMVMDFVGKTLDCGAAITGAVLSAGVGAGGAVAACGKLVAGGARRTPNVL